MTAGTVALGAVGTVTASDEGTYLVAASEAGVRRRLEQAGYGIKNEIVDERVFSVVGADGSDLKTVDGVDHAVPNARIAFEEPALVQPKSKADLPELYVLQWDKHVTDAVPAHDYATGSGSRIAIIDTGIDDGHPDLGNVNTDVSAKFMGGEILEHEGDPHGHGTHVAGTAAATGEEGVIGTAPDAELVSLQVFYFVEPDDPDEDPVLTTTTEDILNAVTYAADIGADVGNLSLGTPPLPPQFNEGGYRGVLTPVYQNAAAKGTVLTSSAGNDAFDLQGGHFSTPNGIPGTMSISATGPNDELSFYSNYGTGQVDVGAPGGGYETLEKTLAEEGVEWPHPTNLVLSSVPADVYGTEYAYFAGTSMAAPQVAGLVALVRELAPGTTSKRVESAIKDGAEGATGQSDSELGAGRINALETVDGLE